MKENLTFVRSEEVELRFIDGDGDEVILILCFAFVLDTTILKKEIVLNGEVYLEIMEVY